MRNARAEEALLKLEPLIQTRVRRRLRRWPAERRDDVEQDARLKLWKVLTSDTVIDRPEAYGQRLIDNAINDALRDISKRRGVVILDCEFAADDDPADNAAMNDLKLTPGQQDLLDLFKKLGSAAAIAEHLRLPRQTISERLSRLRRAVKENLAA